MDSEQMTAVTSESGVAMERRGVRIVDTFAEAFDMRAARVMITAKPPAWARTAAQTMTGFATSVIGCKVEAGIEAELAPEDTPDGRPGASALLFGFDADGLRTGCSIASGRPSSRARRPRASTACRTRPSA